MSMAATTCGTSSVFWSEYCACLMASDIISENCCEPSMTSFCVSGTTSIERNSFSSWVMSHEASCGSHSQALANWSCEAKA